MAFRATEILSDWAPANITTGRDSGNVIYLLLVEFNAAPDTARVYRSLDGGFTFALHSSPPHAENNAHRLMLDNVDRLWIGTGRYNSANQPSLLLYTPSPAGWALAANFTTNTDCLNVRFAQDCSRTSSGGSLPGYPVFFAVWTRSIGGTSTVFWASTRGNLDERIDTTTGGTPGDGTPQYDPQVAVSERGRIFFAYHVGASPGRIEAKEIISLSTPTLTSALVANVLTNAASCEDMAINPLTGLPGILYRDTGQKLRLTELLTDGVTWFDTKVWDGTNDYLHNAGRSRVTYDNRGSVYVNARPVISGREEPALFSQIRALGAILTWELLRMTQVASSLDAVAGGVFGNRGHHDRSGLMADTFAQGFAGLFWIQPPGSTASQADLFWIDADEYPGQGVYPSFFEPTEGDPPPRDEDEGIEDLPSIVLSGEGVAIETYPFTPDQVLDESAEAEDELVQFEIGDFGGMAKYADIRAVLLVRQAVLTDAELVTWKAFLEDRYDDGAPFKINRLDDPTKLIAGAVLDIPFDEDTGTTAADLALSAGAAVLASMWPDTTTHPKDSPAGGSQIVCDGVEASNAVAKVEEWASGNFAFDFTLRVWFRSSADIDTTDRVKELITRGEGEIALGWDRKVGTDELVFRVEIKSASTTNRLELEDEAKNPAWPATFRDGQWHVMLVRWDLTDLEIWFDGAKIATTATTISELKIAADNYYTFGGLRAAVGGAISRNFDGEIDAPKIWGRALEDEEVVAAMKPITSGTIRGFAAKDEYEHDRLSINAHAGDFRFLQQVEED